MLLIFIILGMGVMSFISFRFEELKMDIVLWLFIQSMCLYLAFLTFQTLFFDRFIACFKIRGNVGFFIVLIDFLGYVGTAIVLLIKELVGSSINWLNFYNLMAGYVGIFCAMIFITSLVYLQLRYKRDLKYAQLYQTKSPQLNIAYNSTYNN